MNKAIIVGVLALAASANAWADIVSIAQWKANPTVQVGDATFTLGSTTFADSVTVNLDNLGSPLNRLLVTFNDPGATSGVFGGIQGLEITYTVSFASASKAFTFAQVSENSVIAPAPFTTTIFEPNPDVVLNYTGTNQTASIPGQLSSLTVKNSVSSTGGPLNSFGNTFFFAAVVPEAASIAYLGLGAALGLMAFGLRGRRIASKRSAA